MFLDFNALPALLKEFPEVGKGRHMRYCTSKVSQAGRDMIEKGRKLLLESQKSIGPESLHKSLS